MRHTWQDEHIIHTIKSLLKAFYATLGIFLIFFVLFHIITSFYTSHISEKSLKDFKSGIAEEKTYLKEQGDAASKNYQLIDSLVRQDRSHLLEIIQTEKDTRLIGLMSVANAEGIIIGRTINPKKYGDNVFLTAPVGRVVSQGSSTESIELTGFGNELFMTTGRPIFNDKKMLGALFANNLMNDAYARRFKDKYLPRGAEVIFYTKAFGVYGDSFEGKDTNNLIDSYFNVGSEWITNGLSNKTVSFDDHSSYTVLNVPLLGLEKVTGGALIFIPRKDVSNVAHVSMSSFAFIVFLILAYRLHRRSRKDERGWRYYVVLLGSAILVFIMVLIGTNIQDGGRLALKRIPYILYNSTIRLQPEYGIYNIGFEQHVLVMVDTGDEKINAVQIKLRFDPSSLEVKSIDVGTSTCSYVVENKINQNEGTAVLACGIVDSNEGVKSIQIADITISPLKAGSASLSFDQVETRVLADDGLGTNVLRTSQDGSYRFDNFNTQIDSEASTTPNGKSFVVFSTTHPNENRWYNESKARFVWRGNVGAVYHYSFDTSPNTTPDNEHTLQGTDISIPLPGDGIYYFHLQLASGGPVADYRIQSDLSPPTILRMNLSKDSIVAGDVVRFSFKAEDLVSGIQNNYYVDLGNHLFLPVGQELFVPFIDAGDQSITLRVYDRAGNYTEKSQVVHVEKEK